METNSCDTLPRKAKRALIGSLRQPAGTRLAVDWYEYRKNSNFDRWPREQIKTAAEQDGFVEYKGGHPWVTDAGHTWAVAQPIS